MWFIDQDTQEKLYWIGGCLVAVVAAILDFGTSI